MSLQARFSADLDKLFKHLLPADASGQTAEIGVDQVGAGTMYL
jgi:hypothetical protein